MVARHGTPFGLFQNNRDITTFRNLRADPLSRELCSGRPVGWEVSHTRWDGQSPVEMTPQPSNPLAAEEFEVRWASTGGCVVNDARTSVGVACEELVLQRLQCAEDVPQLVVD